MTHTTAEVIEFMQIELRKIFPTSGLYIRPWLLIGQTNIHCTYTNAATAADCSNGILENDPAYMRLTIWNDQHNPGMFYVDAPCTHGNVLKKVGIKRFMTIKGNTEMECAVKIVAWMRKHSKSFLSLGLRG